MSGGDGGSLRHIPGPVLSNTPRFQPDDPGGYDSVYIRILRSA